MNDTTSTNDWLKFPGISLLKASESFSCCTEYKGNDSFKVYFLTRVDDEVDFSFL